MGPARPWPKGTPEPQRDESRPGRSHSTAIRTIGQLNHPFIRKSNQQKPSPQYFDRRLLLPAIYGGKQRAILDLTTRRRYHMQSRCPKCGSKALVAQDIEMMSNSTVLVKLEKRIQLYCADCCWMGFDDPVISLKIAKSSSTACH